MDTEAAKAAFGNGLNHQICVPTGKAYNHGTHSLGKVIEVPGGYMVRNDAIVAHSDVLLAFPQTCTEVLRSGTWATIRRARKAGVEVHLFPLSKHDYADVGDGSKVCLDCQNHVRY